DCGAHIQDGLGLVRMVVGVHEARHHPDSQLIATAGQQPHLGADRPQQRSEGFRGHVAHAHRVGHPINSMFCWMPEDFAHHRRALAWASMRSIMISARIARECGAYGPFHAWSISTLRATLQESAEDRGTCAKMT